MTRNLEDMKTVDDGASSSTAPGSTYEVFLSFRGADIRLGFTDHLYCNLIGAGIRTFRDNEELGVGKGIDSDLMKAIEESSISIPIFSKDYASSKWCLRELARMVMCMNDKDPEGRQRHTVCPIFYDVTPHDVKHQEGSFKQAFVKHTEEVDARTVKEWKDALEKVSELKGWERAKIADKHEGQLVDIIVREVCMKLKKRNVHLTSDLVGMDHHREEMIKLLDIYSDNGARIVGITGMGGIGKTTIAKYMYNQLCYHFQQQCSFLEDVRENVMRNGCAELQKQLISEALKRSADKTMDITNAFSCQKVLIVLDDVENRTQLTDIIRGPAYFGSGSRIIVTTRNKDVFIEKEGDLIYEPSVMDPDDSFLLFRKYAFKNTQPRDGYEEISREIAQTAAGLPLSLVVIGSMLFRKESQEDWEATLKELRTIPANDVQNRLKISYNSLNSRQKEIFLDIACHFIGKDKTFPFYMWEDFGFFPESGIDALINLSLITIRDDNVLRMHDQLRDLGRNIVYEEKPNDPGQRSRLWSRVDVLEVLETQSGTREVQTLSVDDSISFSNQSQSPPDLELSSLEEIYEPYEFVEYACSKNRDELPISKALSALSEKKSGYKKNSEYATGHQYDYYIKSNDDIKGLSNLRYLNLEDSELKEDFEGLFHKLRCFRWGFRNPTEFHLREFRMPITNFRAKKLVTLDLSGSGISDGWESWIQIKEMTNLKALKLSRCFCLRNLPECLWKMNSLLELDLSGTKIEISSYDIGNLTNLTKLLLSSLNIKRLPETIGKLEKLQVLDCSFCGSLEGQLPEGIGKLSSLRVLDLSSTMIDMLPEDVGGLCNLRELKLQDTMIKKLHGVGIERLPNLEVLDCSDCSELAGEVPSGIGKLTSLRVLDLSDTEVDTLPEDVGGLFNLRKLNLSNYIKKLPGLGIERLQKLEGLDCSMCSSLEGQLPEGIGRLSSLRVLNLSDTMIDMLPEDVGGLCNLRELKLQNTMIKKLPGVGIERLRKLEVLDCSDCSELAGEVPSGIGRLSSLRVLDLSRTQIDTLPEDVGGLINLRKLNLSNYIKKLPQVGMERLQMLVKLDCSGCWSLEGQLPEGIGRLTSLRILNLSRTKITGSFPKDISRLSKLETLDLRDCKKLQFPAEELKLPLSLIKVHIPLTAASLNGISGLVNLIYLTFCKNFGYCCETVEEEVVGVYMPNKLKDLTLSGLDHEEMSYRLLKAMKFDSSSRINSLCIQSCLFEGLPQLDLSILQKLKKLHICDCHEMYAAGCIRDFTSLKKLYVGGCPHLFHVDWPNLEGLEVITEE